jgi:hypothetical protein
MAIVTIQPADIETKHLSFYKFDAKAKKDQYEEKQKTFIVSPRFRYDNQPLAITIRGEIGGKGINVATFSKKAAYSVGVVFDDETQLEGLNAVQEWYTSYLSDLAIFEDYEVVDLVREDRIYLKLRVDDEGKRFLFQSNQKLNPKRIEDANVYQGMNIEALCDFGVYINFETKKTGLNFTVKEINFIEE